MKLPNFVLHISQIDTPNKAVADAVEKCLIVLFEKVNCCVVRIDPNKRVIDVKGLTEQDDELMDISEGWSRVQMELKDDCRNRIPERMAFFLTETMMDNWNKFHATEFILLYVPDDYSIGIKWNVGMDDGMMKAYWVSNDQDGYNLKAPFWTREWMKPEHKNPAQGGGKI